MYKYALGWQSSCAGHDNGRPKLQQKSNNEQPQRKAALVTLAADVVRKLAVW